MRIFIPRPGTSTAGSWPRYTAITNRGLRTGDQIILRGWSRADGYAGLEPQRCWTTKNCLPCESPGFAGCGADRRPTIFKVLIARDDDWFEVPDPLPRVRLVNRTIASEDPAADIAKIDIEREALSEVPLVFPPAKPGSAAIIEDLPGRMNIRTQAASAQLLVVAESYHPGWKADRKRLCPARCIALTATIWVAWSDRAAQLVTLQFQPSSLRTGPDDFLI